MIVGPDFIWLHFPKTAGVSTEKAIRELFPTAKSHLPPHQSLSQRLEIEPDFQIEGYKIICGFRRLPHWILSRVHYGMKLNPQHQFTREMLVEGKFFMRDGGLRQADYNAHRFGSPGVDHWIRIESIAEDLARALGLEPEIVARTLPRLNETSPYSTVISDWFSPLELSMLYDANPRWAMIERQVYGSLLTG